MAAGKCQTACKPGSVRPMTGRDDHSSGTHLTMRLTRPTRAAGREHPCNYHGLNRNITAAPIRSCSRWGLPCRPCCQGRGALLPHRFALARGTGLLAPAGLAQAVCFLWHFPWGHPRRPLAGTVFPWSPDFPPPTGLPVSSGRPAVWRCRICAPARGWSSISRRDHVLR
jgi:hypothetical protein